jgi:uncharacterized protein (DUF1778 family)
MISHTQATDSEGRISLPKGFANATVIVDQLSETELRIRKAMGKAEHEADFYEETIAPLSDAGRDRFLELLDNPPEPSAALKRAVERRSTNA